MLERLYVQNYALIDQLELGLQPGLTVLTGETGAGKSLLLGAIGLILGERADPSVLVVPDAKCIVEAEFALPDLPSLQAWLAEQSLDIDLPDAQLLIRREISPSGKSRAFVNDTPVPLTDLRQLASRLVDLHGQHEGHQLMDPVQQLALLDEYAGLQPHVREFALTLTQLRSVHQHRQTLRAQSQKAAQGMALAQHQFEELTAAQLDSREESGLEAELRLLDNADTVLGALALAAEVLDGEELGVNVRLAQLQRELERLANVDSAIGLEAQRLREAVYALRETAANLQAVSERVELDPERLQFVQQRLATYHSLRLKYQVRTTDELIALRESLAVQLAPESSLDHQLQELEVQISTLQSRLLKQGLALEVARLEAAAELTQRLEATLAAVGLPNARVQIALQRIHAPDGLLPQPSEGLPALPAPPNSLPNKPQGATPDPLAPISSGFDRVEFWVQMNQGYDLAPMRSVASGGELSRVLLACKAALAARLRLPTLIFDEIDTGISGEAALRVARLLADLSQTHQLLAITHLPQIAARGRQHLRIWKDTVDGRTVTRLSLLDSPEREAAIAWMISGSQADEAARASARALLALE
jgi:DNA repair protein RecN (Recombination protein N)